MKLSVNNTLESIKYCIKSLKIIDELAAINFCENLYSLGKIIQSLTNLPDSLESVQSLKNNTEFLEGNF